MTKLSNDMRERIARRASEKAFEKRVKENAKREDKLARECYNFVFPKKIRDAVADVPDGWLRKCSCLQFNAGGWTVRLTASAELPTPFTANCSMLGNIPAGELADKVQQHVQDEKKMREEARELFYKVKGFLDAFGSVKRLKEAWPEGYDFYKDFDVERVKENVPAVVVAEINSAIGLKTTATSE